MIRYVPDRGDVIWIDHDSQAGHEQSGRRAAVVVSPSSYNRKAGLVLCCPITNQVKGYPFEVAIPIGVPVTGVVLADQVRSMDWQARNDVPHCQLPDAVIQLVLAKLQTLME